MAFPNACSASKIIAPDMLNRIIYSRYDKRSKASGDELLVVGTPVFERWNDLLFLWNICQDKLKPGEFRVTLSFDELTEFGLALLMAPAFKALEEKRGNAFDSLHEAIDSYILACLESHRTHPSYTTIELVLYSDDFWADVAKMNNPSIAYIDDGLAPSHEYQDDSPYRCQTARYYDTRCQDTLCGWTYTVHPNSICLTPPRSWEDVPTVLNINWYKRPLYWSVTHEGYFLSKSSEVVKKVNELGAVYDPNEEVANLLKTLSR
jgi:hypothetical protein